MQRTLSRLDNCSICFSTCVELGLHNGLEQTCCTVLMYLIWLGWIISPVLMSICLFFSPGGQHGHMQPFSDEDASIETLSHCSSFSDTASVADEGKCVCTPGYANTIVFYVLQSLFELGRTRAGYDVSECFCMGQCFQFVHSSPKRNALHAQRIAWVWLICCKVSYWANTVVKLTFRKSLIPRKTKTGREVYGAKCNSANVFAHIRKCQFTATALVVLPGGEASEDTAQEDFQYKLKGFIDSTVDKR